MRSGTDFGQEVLVHSLHCSSYQQCSMQLRSGLCVSQSSSSKPNPFKHVFVGLVLCTGAQSCWNRKEPSPKYKVEIILQNVLESCAEALRFSFTENKGSSPTPERQPHTIIPPNFTRLTNLIAKQRRVICHSTQQISSAPDSSGDVLYTTISNALHCTCEACM